MKDFTTSDNITPVLEDIESHFFIDQAPKIKFLNNINIVLTAADEAGPGVTCYLIGPENPENIPYTKGLKELYHKIDLYCKAAETYAGELDDWSSREKDRATIAAGAALLKKYAGPAAHNNGPIKF